MSSWSCTYRPLSHLQPNPPPLTPYYSPPGAQKLEGELLQLRQQKVQLDASVKARDREAERLAKSMEALKLELHEANAK